MAIPAVVCTTSTITLLAAELVELIPRMLLAAPIAVVVVNPVTVTKSPIDVDPIPVTAPVPTPVILLKSTEIKSIT